MSKKSYRSDVIRFAFLGVALAVFFVGPRFVQSDIAEDIDDTLSYIQTHKIKNAAPIIRQLKECKQFAKENTSSIAIASIKMSSVNWLALLIIVLGLGAPLIMKYFENKKAGNA